MHYLIDGYNLVFKINQDISNLEKSREEIIAFLREKISKTKIKASLIFDANKTDAFDLHYEYFDEFDVIFSEKDQTADELILEKITIAKHKKELTVVTSDNRLAIECRSMGANTKSITSFLNFLHKKSSEISKEETKQAVDSDHNIKRLQNIFEKKLKDK
jgi:predicted RNA-binding protein with PIN domain